MQKLYSVSAAVLATVLWLMVPGAVIAQEDSPSETELAAQRDEQGRQLYMAGAAAFEEGRFFDALDYFQTSYQLTQRPELLFNIGQTADRLWLDELAIESFQGYLGALPDAPNREPVLERLRILREAVALREVEVAAEVARDESPNGEDATQDASDEERAAVAVLAADPDPASSRRQSILTRWWFWTAVGVVVAGGVAAGVLLTDPADAELVQGNLGATVFTLRGAP